MIGVTARGFRVLGYSAYNDIALLVANRYHVVAGLFNHDNELNALAGTCGQSDVLRVSGIAINVYGDRVSARLR